VVLARDSELQHMHQHFAGAAHLRQQQRVVMGVLVEEGLDRLVEGARALGRKVRVRSVIRELGNDLAELLAR
jgi:predicted nucleotidyltransferase